MEALAPTLRLVRRPASNRLALVDYTPCCNDRQSSRVFLVCKRAPFVQIAASHFGKDVGNVHIGPFRKTAEAASEAGINLVDALDERLARSAREFENNPTRFNAMPAFHEGAYVFGQLADRNIHEG